MSVDELTANIMRNLKDSVTNAVGELIPEEVNVPIPSLLKEILSSIVKLTKNSIFEHLNTNSNAINGNVRVSRIPPDLEVRKFKQEHEYFTNMLNEREDLYYKFARYENLLELYQNCMKQQPIYIPRKFRSDKYHVMSPSELIAVNKMELQRFKTECDIFALRKDLFTERFINIDTNARDIILNSNISTQAKNLLFCRWEECVNEDKVKVDTKWLRKVEGMKSAFIEDEKFIKEHQKKRIATTNENLPSNAANIDPIHHEEVQLNLEIVDNADVTNETLYHESEELVVEIVEETHAANVNDASETIIDQPNPPPQNIKPKLINLSRRNLTHAEISLLSKGPKFCPTTKGNFLEIKADVKEFTRKLKIMEKFHGSTYNEESLVKEKSNINPKTENKDLAKIIETIEQTDPISINLPDNLTPQERKALKDLTNYDDVIIKKADKGDALVIMDTLFYKDKLVLADHLQTETYENVNANSDNKVFKELKLLMSKYKSNVTKKELSYITNFEWKSSLFYVLPKIHKCKSIIEKMAEQKCLCIVMEPPPDLKGRAIVAGTNSPTQRLSELLEKILSPLVRNLKSYIKDDWDFIRKFPQKFEHDCHLYSCDIVNLYTNISHELGLKALEYWIHKLRDLIAPRFTTEFILNAALFVLQHNNCLFDGYMYKQLIGTAMGTKFAPPYACLSIGFLEETKLYPELPLYFPASHCDFIIETFFRFMDDGITPWPKALDINVFNRILNNLDEKIEFTMEPASIKSSNNEDYQSLNYLDIAVILHPTGQIETDIYYKPTNTHDYLDFYSHHPIHIKKNIPYVLSKRIIVFVSNCEKKAARLLELKNWLLQSNYPAKLIKKGFHNAHLQGPAPKKIRDVTLPIVSTFYSNYDASHLVKCSDKLLKDSRNERVNTIFGNSKILLALKQPPNLLRQISKAELNSIKNNAVENGIFKCTDKRCKLCQLYIQECNSFLTSNNVEWIVKCRITCNSRNVIYFLKCICCNFEVTYTGKTNVMRLRMNNHVTGCRYGNSSDRFDNHVYSCRLKHKCTKEPFFQIYAFIKLPHEHLLITYESYFHSKGFDTMN